MHGCFTIVLHFDNSDGKQPLPSRICSDGGRYITSPLRTHVFVVTHHVSRCGSNTKRGVVFLRGRGGLFFRGGVSIRHGVSHRGSVSPRGGFSPCGDVSLHDCEFNLHFA